MARLIVVDASVAIAALSARDVRHKTAVTSLSSLQDEDELVLTATTRTEILVGPERVGGDVLRSASAFIAGCTTIPVTAAIADAAAILKARRNALSVPDAVALAVADTIGADLVWTFDQRWAGIDPRVTIPVVGGL